MSNPDDRFIAYVCDKGALTLDGIAARIGDTTQKAEAILRWIGSRDSEAARRYAALEPSGSYGVYHRICR
jgi:hypothetical protein